MRMAAMMNLRVKLLADSSLPIDRTEHIRFRFRFLKKPDSGCNHGNGNLRKPRYYD